MILGKTFVDTRGVTHESLELSYREGAISLCGQLREPVSGVGRETFQLRALAHVRRPEDVDCMTCMARRVRLDLLAQDATPGYRPPMVELLVRITSWG